MIRYEAIAVETRLRPWAGELLELLDDLDIPCHIVSTEPGLDHRITPVIVSLKGHTGGEPIYSFNFQHPEERGMSTLEYLVEILGTDQATAFFDYTYDGAQAAERAGVTLVRRRPGGEPVEDLAVRLADAYEPTEGGAF